MQKFLSFLDSITKLSDAAKTQIIQCAKKETLPKKHLLIPNLARCERLFFIEEGLARAFFYHDEKEITDWFGIENMIIGPTVRHFPIKETIHTVELLERTTVISVAFSDLEKLYQNYHEIERLGRMIAIQTILHLQFKIDSIQLFSAKERYEHFINTYPSIIQRVPLSYIASYLGMNQVTLSRIRKIK